MTTDHDFQDHWVSDRKILYLSVAGVLVTSLFFLKQAYEFHTMVGSVRTCEEVSKLPRIATKPARKSILRPKLNPEVDSE